MAARRSPRQGKPLPRSLEKGRARPGGAGEGPAGRTGGAGRAPDKGIDEGTAIFRKYLAGLRLKMTHERRLILEQVFSSDEHFGADDLYLRFARNRLAVSRATVYRTLEHLVKSGLVRRIYLDQKRAFFEKVHGREHHEHMICLSCGKVIEFTDNPLEERQELVCRQLKFKPLRHALRIVGLCEACQ